MRLRYAICLILFGLLAVSVPYAQSGSYVLTFTASADHTVSEHGAPKVQKYELVIDPAGAAAPLPAIDLGKPAPDAQNVIRVTSIHAQIAALPLGSYDISVRAVGPGGAVASAAVPFNPTQTTPAAPGAPGLSRSGQ